MDFLTVFHPNDITIWTVTGTDGFGNPSFASPKHVKGRWEDRTDLVQNNDGQLIPSRAKVFLGVDVNVGDYIYNGKSFETNPLSVSGAFRVIRFMSTPSFDGTAAERKAIL